MYAKPLVGIGLALRLLVGQNFAQEPVPAPIPLLAGTPTPVGAAAMPASTNFGKPLQPSPVEGASGCVGSQACYGSCFPFIPSTVNDCHCEHCTSLLGKLERARARHREYFALNYEPPCAGAYVNRFIETQKASGLREQFTFRPHDFSIIDGASAQLSPAGKRKASEIARLWGTSPAPISLASNTNFTLLTIQMEVVVRELNQLGVPVSEEGIGINHLPGASAISGTEAISIYQQRLMGSPLNPISGSSGSQSGTAAVNVGGNQPVR